MSLSRRERGLLNAIGRQLLQDDPQLAARLGPVEALRQAQQLAVPLGAKVLATACWDDPQVYAGYVAMGIDRFEERVEMILNEAVEKAFGPETPPNVIPRVVRGHPRDALIDASRHADMIIVGRRGHGGFGGLLLGSVSSACVAHAHCPVLVVHSPKQM